MGIVEVRSVHDVKRTHTHTHTVARMSGPDCAVMCNLINTHTLQQYKSNKLRGKEGSASSLID